MAMTITIKTNLLSLVDFDNVSKVVTQRSLEAKDRRIETEMATGDEQLSVQQHFLLFQSARK
jgi:hypothetical protein